MISGIATAAKALKPSIRVIAAEPTGTQGPQGADVARCKVCGLLRRGVGVLHQRDH